MWTRPILRAIAAALLLFALVVYTKQPSHDRDWQPHLARTPIVERSGDQIAISPIRDWTYDQRGETATDWREEGTRLDPATLRRVWFVLEPHPGLPVMAHTLVLFEFGDGALVGLTIEARKQRHEKFAPLAGAFRRFELVYVWATPKDLLTRRAVYLDHEVYIYPLDLTETQARDYLNALTDRTAAITQAPRFYNTLHSNCTNELAKTAGLGWQPAFVLTGRSDEALYDLGLIPGGTFESARIGADMTRIIRGLNGETSDAFNAGLLEALTPR